MHAKPMFTVAYDLPTSCWVGVHSGPSSTNADYEACIETLAIVDRDGETPLKAAMLVVDPGDHVPNATMRWKFAELRRLSRSRHRFAFVSDSRIARAAVVAVHWVQPAGSEQVVKAWPTVEQGIAWLERERDQVLPILRQLYTHARTHGSPPHPDSRIESDAR